MSGQMLPHDKHSLAVASMIVTAVLLHVNPAHAEPSPFRGIGFAKCSDFVQWQDDGIDLTGVWSWLYGYWTGLNLEYSADADADTVQKDLFHFSASPDAILEQIGEICRSDQEEFIVNAGADIFARLPEFSE